LVYLHNVAEGMVDSVNNSWVLEFIWEKLVKKDVLSVLWFFFLFQIVEEMKAGYVEANMMLDGGN
jgi:hypothetical protein